MHCKYNVHTNQKSLCEFYLTVIVKAFFLQEHIETVMPQSAHLICILKAMQNNLHSALAE